MKFRQVFAGAVCACAVVALGVVDVEAQLANSAWPDYGNGNANTHRTTAIGPAGPGITTKWTYTIPEGNGQTYAHSQPSIAADGAVCLAAYGIDFSSTIVINSDGTGRWRMDNVDVGRWVTLDNSNRLLHTAWFSGSSSSVAARSLSNGAVAWHHSAFSVSSDLQSSPAIAPNGTVYAHNDGGNLRALTSTGGLIWSVPSGAGGPYSNPAITPGGTIITGGRRLAATSTAGANLWSIAADDVGYFTSPALDPAGNVYAGEFFDEKFVSLTPAGAVRWTRPGIGGAPAIAEDGTIYTGYEGTFYALDPSNGATKWTYPTGPIDEFGAEGVTVDGHGNIYLSTAAGHVLSLTPDGALRWDFDLEPDLTRNIWPSAPVLGADGVLYVGGGLSGNVFALVPEPGMLSLAAVPLLLLRRSRWLPRGRPRWRPRGTAV